MKRFYWVRASFMALSLCIMELPGRGQEPEDRQLPREQLRERIDEERPQEGLVKEHPNGRTRVRPRTGQLQHKIIYLTPEMKKSQPMTLREVMSQAAANTTIPMWSYSTAAYDLNTYTGAMVGRSPFFHGTRTTNIPAVIIPLIFKIAGTTFDPTVKDTPCSVSDTAVNLVLQSPLLSNTSQSMNGVNVGTGQYTDLFQRANFWSDVSTTGNSYHVVLSPVTVLSAMTLSPTAADAIVVPPATTGGCGPLGVISNTWFDNLLQTTIIPGLTPSGVGPTVFPIFVLYNVVQSSDTPPTFTNCCILGYHNAFGAPVQTYSPLDFDGAQLFDTGFTSTMSHEIAEWLDDPVGSNATPPWGAEGQVTSPNCQNNLEVGDPLSPGFGTPSNSFSIMMPNGVTYGLQELAFYSWFFGGTSLGAGGKFSNNGTFSGFAVACPPGGTH